jgi:ribonuclease III
MQEGELTSLRAALVRAQTLPLLRVNWKSAILCAWAWVKPKWGRERTPLLCAAFEAVIGAIYLDQGLDNVRRLVQRLAEPALEKIQADSLHKDAKSEFQVWAQAHYNVTPHYEVVAASGPDHAKIFTVQALVGAWCGGRAAAAANKRPRRPPRAWR